MPSGPPPLMPETLYMYDNEEVPESFATARVPLGLDTKASIVNTSAVDSSLYSVVLRGPVRTRTTAGAPEAQGDEATGGGRRHRRRWL